MKTDGIQGRLRDLVDIQTGLTTEASRLLYREGTGIYGVNYKVRINGGTDK